MHMASMVSTLSSLPGVHDAICMLLRPQQEYLIEKKRVSNFHTPYQNEAVKHSKVKQLPSKNC